MIEVTGNFWQYVNTTKPNAIVCTINQIVKADGSLVMGAGIAKDFALNYKWLPKNWGNRIIRYKNSSHIPPMFVTLCKEEPHLIALSTKYHWKDGSDINLIIKGIEGMRNLTDFTGWAKIVMTRPGCGNGGLEWAKVKPVLDTFLDDRFIICNR